MQRTIEESRMSSAAVPSPREARAANGAGSWEFMETVWNWFGREVLMVQNQITKFGIRFTACLFRQFVSSSISVSEIRHTFHK